MENLNLIIANNLKKIREERKLSLDKVADLTGVSKSMLGQIERGDSNPTITTAWKIANGLKISFSALINMQKSDTVVIDRKDIEPLIEDNGRYRVYPFFPYEDNRRFEVYSFEIDKGGYLGSEAHTDGTQEFITVFQGQLTIRVNNEEFIIENGNSIRFKADKAHSYHNSGNEMIKANMVINYQI